MAGKLNKIFKSTIPYLYCYNYHRSSREAEQYNQVKTILDYIYKKTGKDLCWI